MRVEIELRWGWMRDEWHVVVLINHHHHDWICTWIEHDGNLIELSCWFRGEVGLTHLLFCFVVLFQLKADWRLTNWWENHVRSFGVAPSLECHCQSINHHSFSQPIGFNGTYTQIHKVGVHKYRFWLVACMKQWTRVTRVSLTFRYFGVFWDNNGGGL